MTRNTCSSQTSNDNYLLLSSTVSWHCRPEQIPRRIQRMYERGDPLLVHLWRSEHRGPISPAQSPVRVPGTDDCHELPTAIPISASSSDTASSCAATVNFAHQQRLSSGFQAQPCRGSLTESLRRFPARTRNRWTICFSHPKPHFRLCFNPRNPSLRQRWFACYSERQPRPCQLSTYSIIPGAGYDIVRKCVTGRQPSQCQRWDG